MNFFKKLFSVNESPKSETIISLEVKENNEIKKVALTNNNFVENSKTNDLKIEPSSVSRITGIDNEFINLIYFPNNLEKESHVYKINKALSKLKIKFGTDFNAVHEKIVNYNNIDLDDPIPFIIESLLIENYDIRKDSNGKTEIKSSRGNKGLMKIQNYYSAANFIEENISLKLKCQNLEFDFEEKLFNEYIINSDINNYAKINTFYCLGSAYFKNSNLIKGEYFFNLIEKIQFDLQPSTVSNYYRNIGEDYSEIGENIKALKWLKAGLILNPKLGVKKLISKLEMIK
jgi:hypothetical protein